MACVIQKREYCYEDGSFRGAIDTTCASGELIFNIFSALAQFERRLIQERTKAGLEVARARGRNGGCPKVTAAETKVMLAKKLRVPINTLVGSGDLLELVS